MSSATDAFKINLNQNIWGSIVALVSLGCSEYFDLPVLFWFAVVLSTIMTISVIVTVWAYTANYVRNKAGSESDI